MTANHLKVFLIFTIAILSGCIAPASSKEVSPGVYQIAVGGSALASSDRYHQKIAKKAIKICGGEAYKKVSPTRYESVKTRTYVEGRWMDVHGSRYVALISCQE